MESHGPEAFVVEGIEADNGPWFGFEQSPDGSHGMLFGMSWEVPAGHGDPTLPAFGLGGAAFGLGQPRDISKDQALALVNGTDLAFSALTAARLKINGVGFAGGAIINSLSVSTWVETTYGK